MHRAAGLLLACIGPPAPGGLSRQQAAGYPGPLSHSRPADTRRPMPSASRRLPGRPFSHSQGRPFPAGPSFSSPGLAGGLLAFAGPPPLAGPSHIRSGRRHSAGFPAGSRWLPGAFSHSQARRQPGGPFASRRADEPTGRRAVLRAGKRRPDTVAVGRGSPGIGWCRSAWVEAVVGAWHWRGGGGGRTEKGFGVDRGV